MKGGKRKEGKAEGKEQVIMRGRRREEQKEERRRRRRRRSNLLGELREGNSTKL